jgi:uncharacterized membrane protein YkvA (DUF1232 family)
VTTLLLWSLAAVIALYLLAILVLIAVGRRGSVRALAGFVPDCLVLFARLVRDPRVPRSQRWLMFGVLGYLAMPFDLIPDFIPVAGQLDDVAVVALALRRLVRRSGASLVREHWSGPESSLSFLLRFAGSGA